MAIKVGDRLPDGKLMECTEFDSATQCAMAPKEVNVAEASKGKKIAVFGLPGAYTPTCSAMASASSTSMPRYLTVLSSLVCPSRS